MSDILVPANPLTETGLMSPYVLPTTAGDSCTTSLATAKAFEEATIYDEDTGKMSGYHPLVSDVN